MTSTTNSKKNSSSRGLGRGLGSLLGNQNNEQKKQTKEITNDTQITNINNKIENKTNNNEAKKVVRALSVEERILQVAIEKITTNKEQPRKKFDKAALDSLAQSIKEQGIIQPITVKPLLTGEFEIIAGERRWRASQIAGLHKVPVIVKKVDEQKSLEFALIENIQREDLNVIEEAMAYQHLMNKFDLTQSELAVKVGKDRATVANLLRLIQLAPEVKEMVINGDISLGQAKLLLTLKDFRMQFKVARKVVKSQLNVKQTDKLIKKLKNSAVIEPAINKEVEVQVSSITSEIQKILGTKVKLNYENGKSKLQIQFYSDDELNGFIDKLRENWKR